MMKLKRFCAGLAALCMMGAVVPVLPVQESAAILANAEDTEYTEGTYENLKYKKYADYVEITGYDGTIYGYESSTAQAYAEKYGYKFALIGSAPDTTEPKTEELKAGDANGDGEIDILDVITINKAILGKETLTENGLKAIDFNGNGKPDSDEALTLLKYIVGIITSFN